MKQNTADKQIVEILHKKIILLFSVLFQTQKTPKKEIEQAMRNLQDYLERNDQYDNMERIKG